MKYVFSNFVLDTEKKQLFYENQSFHLPKKSYDLLLLLLQNPGTTYSRNELIEHLWDGRVVTENTVDQCISKLRKSLAAIQPGDYIESVYGHGIKLSVPVEQGDENKHQSSRRNTAWRFPAFIGVAVAVTLLVWVLSGQREQADQNVIIPVPPEQQMRVQWMPVSSLPDMDENAKADAQWLANGSAHYFQQRMAQHQGLRLQIPKKDWLQQDQEKVALQLLKELRTEVVVLADIKYTDQLYRAELKLRNADAWMAQKRFQSERLLSLYQEMEDWLAESLGMQTMMDTDVQELGLSADPFATESYLRAMAAQLTGDSKKAITLLQTAVEQDAEFKVAWFELAVANRKQGDYDKALSILYALNPSTPALQIRTWIVVGQTHDIKGEFDKSEAAYVQADALVKATGEIRREPALRLSQAILYRKKKEFETSRQLLKSAAQMTNQSRDPHFYGIVMNTSARLEQSQKRFRDAIHFSRKAIDSFVLAGDRRYAMLATTTLSNLLFYQGEWRETEYFAESALTQARALASPRHIRDNLEKLAMVNQLTGRLDEAVKQWEDVIQRSATLGLLQQEFTARQKLVETWMDKAAYVDAENSLQNLQDFAEQHQQRINTDALLLTQIRLAVETQQLELAQQLLESQPMTDVAEWLLLKGDVSKLTGDAAAATMAYENALALVEPSQDYVAIADCLNRLIEISLSTDPQRAGELLLKADNYKPFVYPYQKFEAIHAYNNNRVIEAISLLEEVKLKSSQLWQVEDQLLLEQYQNQQSSL